MKLHRRRTVGRLRCATEPLIEATPIGLTGRVQLRQVLQTLNMLVITEQFALPRAHQAFDTDGRLAEARQNEQMTKVVQRLIDVAGRLP
jgi:chromate reductase